MKLPPRPPPADVARAIASDLEGMTGKRAERRVLERLRAVARDPAALTELMRSLYEADARLPDKLIRDLVDRSKLPLRGMRDDATLAALWEIFRPGTALPAGRDGAVEALRKAAFELAVTPATAGRHGHLSVFGARIPRLDEPATRTWLGTFGHRALTAGYAFYDKTFVTKLVNRVFSLHDTESAAEVQRALAAPPPRGPDGAPKSFGDVTVLVNGMLNLVTTPAAAFRIAQQTRGPLVIASSNPAGEDGYRLRPLTELWGQKVPRELEGKLWAIGDLTPNFIPWPEASDLLLEHLGVMDGAFAELAACNPALAKHGSLGAAELTVVGYSQGALSVAAARKRLADAGRPEVIDRVISVAGGFAGTPFADGEDSAEDVQGAAASSSLVQRVSARLLAQVNAGDGRRTFASNDPDFVLRMRRQLGLTPDLVDVAYQARSGGGAGPKVEPFFKATGDWLSDGGPTDGVVLADESPMGRVILRDDEPKTHLVTWKDYQTFDRILEVL